MIVVDSNVLAARVMLAQTSNLARRVEDLEPVWIVPPLWRYEFQNVLVKTISARLTTPEAAMGIWRQIVAKVAENEHEPAAELVLDLCVRYRITAYDANFIALAMEMGVFCVTQDGELQEKFPRLALSMEAFVRPDSANSLVRESRAGYRARRARR